MSKYPFEVRIKDDSYRQSYLFMAADRSRRFGCRVCMAAAYRKNIVRQ